MRWRSAVPAGFDYAVELRHETFFRDGRDRTEALALLTERGVDLVMMDARGLHAGHALAEEQEIIRTGRPVVGKEEKETWPGREDQWVLTTVSLPVALTHGFCYRAWVVASR